VWPKPGRWGGLLLRGEEMVQQDTVRVLGGLWPMEGGEAGLRAAVCEPFGRRQVLGGGGQQEGGPVLVLGGLDCLEVPRF